MKTTTEIRRSAVGLVDMAPVTDKAVKLLANTIFRQLQNEGCQPKDIINISTQLLDLVTNELQKNEDLKGS